MKKLALVLGALLTVGTLSYGKEEVIAPVQSSKEVVAIPEVAIMPVTVAYTPLYNIYGKIGVDVWSKYDEFKYNEDAKAANKKDSKDLGFELALEATKNITDEFELGLGIAYQNHGKPKDSDVFKEIKLGVYEDFYKIPGFDSVPLYAVAKYNFETGTAWKPYLKAALGYSLNFGNEDVTITYVGKSDKAKKEFENGLYYGVGAGVEYENFFVDLMYQVNQAKLKITQEENILWTETETHKKDFNYSRVTLGFGYKFSY